MEYLIDSTLDGGYVIAGSTTSFGKGLEDVFVLKTGSVGHPEWHKTFGGARPDEVLGVVCGDDSRYIIACNVKSSSVTNIATLYQL